MDENALSSVIIRCALEVHRHLGPGLLESVYEEALCYELREAGLVIERQKSVPIVYKGVNLGHDLRLDILVNGKVIVECKSLAENNPIFESQCLTYLKLSGLKLGMVMNFGMELMRQGINRVVNRL